MSNIVKYKTMTIESVAQDRAQMSSGGQFLKLDQGANVVRFLPIPLSSTLDKPYVIAHQHYLRIPGVEKLVVFNCPRMMAKRPCPACQKMEQLKYSGNPADKQAADELYPRLRIFTNVISRKNEDAGPQVYAYGKKIHEALMSIFADSANGGNYYEPTEDGFDIVISRNGMGMETRYDVRPARNSSELGDMSWIEQAPDLATYAIVPSSEEIITMLGGPSAADESVKQRNALTRQPAGRARGRRAEDDMEIIDE